MSGNLFDDIRVNLSLYAADEDLKQLVELFDKVNVNFAGLQPNDPTPGVIEWRKKAVEPLFCSASSSSSSDDDGDDDLAGDGTFGESGTSRSPQKVPIGQGVGKGKEKEERSTRSRARESKLELKEFDSVRDIEWSKAVRGIVLILRIFR